MKYHWWTDPLFWGSLGVEGHKKALGGEQSRGRWVGERHYSLLETHYPKAHPMPPYARHFAVSPTLAPGSCNVERLFALLNRINRHDRRMLAMHSLEMPLVVTRDAGPWPEYNYAELVRKYMEKRRVRKLRAPRSVKGKKRKRQSDSQSDSPACCSEPDSQSSAEDVSSVDTSGTYYSNSSNGQCDTSS